MNVDVLRVQALALSITIVTVCHMPHPQLSIDRGSAPYHVYGWDKPKNQKLHITERGKPILLCPLVHSLSHFCMANAIVHIWSWTHGYIGWLGTGKWCERDITTWLAHVLDWKLLETSIRLPLLKMHFLSWHSFFTIAREGVWSG